MRSTVIAYSVICRCADRSLSGAPNPFGRTSHERVEETLPRRKILNHAILPNTITLRYSTVESHSKRP